MATEKLKIILDADWKGKSDIRAANDDIEGLGKSSKVGAIALAGLGAAFAAAGVAAKLTMDSFKRGAELDLVATKFDNLTASIGTSSDALLNDMKRASDGMVSNANLMAGATELMSGKLAKSHGEVVRLSTVATQLGWDMGVLAQTINNQSVLRLDNLGVAAEDVIPKFEALKAAGMDVKAAFTEALISAGEAKLEVLGSKAETAAGQILQIKAAWEDTRDAFDVGVLTGVSGQLDTIATNAVSMSEAAGLLGERWGSAIGYVIDRSLGAEVAQRKWNEALAAGLVNEKEANSEIAKLSGGYISTEESLTKLNTRTQFWLDIQGESISVAESADVAMLSYANSIMAIEAAARGAIGDVQSLNEAIAGLSTQGILQELQFIGGPNVSAGRMAAGRTATSRKTPYSSAVDPNKYQAWQSTMIMSRRETYSMRDAMAAAEDATKGFGGSLGSVASDAEILAGEMSALASATGDYFMEARRAKDFNPFEALLESADKYGANALQLAGVGVAGGLFDEGQAQEYLKRAALMQRADMLGQAIATGQITAEQAASMLGGLKEGFDSGQVLADEFFAGINEQELMPQMLLNTQPGWDDYLAVKQRIESNPPTVVVRVVNAVAAANADNIRGPIE